MPKVVGLTLPYYRYSFERALEGIARAGYQYVAFGTTHGENKTPVPEEGNAAEVNRLRSLFRLHGLQPAVLFAHSQFHPDDPLERAEWMLQFAHELEIPEVNTLGFWGYHEFPTRPLSKDEYDALNTRFVHHYIKLADTAKRFGVVITLKPHAGNTATAPILLDTLRQIDSSYVRACYDPGNVGYYEGVDPETDFPQIVSETISFVAKEQGSRGLRNYDFSVPGEGVYNFKEMFKLMYEHGFDGPVIVEKLDKDGKPLDPEEIDVRMERAKKNLETLLTEAGFRV